MGRLPPPPSSIKYETGLKRKSFAFVRITVTNFELNATESRSGMEIRRRKKDLDGIGGKTLYFCAVFSVLSRPIGELGDESSRDDKRSDSTTFPSEKSLMKYSEGKESIGATVPPPFIGYLDASTDRRLAGGRREGEGRTEGGTRGR